MTPTESVMLVRFVEAVCPQQAIDDYTADAWYEVLGNLDLAECRQAVKNIARRKPFVSPAEIIKEIAESRSADVPHSGACRGSDHRDCRFSWCGCVCHPMNLREFGSSDGDPRQLGTAFDNPDSPWGEIEMGYGPGDQPT